MRDEEQLYKEFDQLIGRHRRLIRFLCQRASYGREAHCRDLIQECYVAMLKHLPGREPRQSGRHELRWVYWQCRSAIDSYRRKMQRMIEVQLSDEKKAELQEAFYYFKTEAMEQFSDDELIEYMVKVFNGRAQGSTEYLSS